MFAPDNTSWKYTTRWRVNYSLFWHWWQKKYLLQKKSHILLVCGMLEVFPEPFARQRNFVSRQADSHPGSLFSSPRDSLPSHTRRLLCAIDQKNIWHPNCFLWTTRLGQTVWSSLNTLLWTGRKRTSYSDLTKKWVFTKKEMEIFNSMSQRTKITNKKTKKKKQRTKKKHISQLIVWCRAKWERTHRSPEKICRKPKRQQWEQPREHPPRMVRSFGSIHFGLLLVGIASSSHTTFSQRWMTQVAHHPTDWRQIHSEFGHDTTLFEKYPHWIGPPGEMIRCCFDVSLWRSSL